MVYLTVNKETLDKTVKEAKANYILSFGEGEELLYTHDMEGCSVSERAESLEFADGELKIDKSIMINGNELAFFSVTVELTPEVVGKIIEEYSKRINKMRTVLEGIKK